MSTFKDAMGREWTFSITVIEIKRLRDQLHIDLLETVSDKADQMFARLDADPVLLVDLISILLTEQIEKIGLDDRGFAAGLVGDGIENAKEALIREIANFFGPHRGKLILAAWNQIKTGTTVATALAQRKLESLDIEAIATKRFDEAYAKAQEKFGT